MINPDYALLEKAYESVIYGENPPTMMACSGELIMQYRPELTLSPKAIYLVTKDEIRLLEDE